MLELTVPVGVADHVLGPPRAPVTVVEYGDFECPNCKQAAAAVKIMLARFAGRVRFAYRHFPLEGEHPRAHPHALQAALAAEAAGAQGKFWAMHDLLFENQRQLELPQLRRYAQHLDLDLARYDTAMADERCLRRVREHVAGAERSEVRGTPGFFINGVAQDVSFGMEHLLEGVEAALPEPTIRL
jgi:protein-disulfide isomerase